MSRPVSLQQALGLAIYRLLIILNPPFDYRDSLASLTRTMSCKVSNRKHAAPKA